MILKVLIADDEVKVCRMISCLVNWAELGLEIIGMAHDGISALEFIRVNQPDIVITDIKMPGYDGIELIRAAKECASEANFIIVSGYRYFDYAHDAIKYGVEDYLLKPLKKSDLENVLHKIVAQKRSEKDTQAHLDYLKSNLDTAEKSVSENLIAWLCAVKNGDWLQVDIKGVNEEFRCRFTPGVFRVGILRPNIPWDDNGNRAYELLLKKAKDILLEEMERASRYVVASVAAEGVVFVVNTKTDDREGLVHILHRVRKSLLSLRDIFLKITVTIGVGEAVSDISQLQYSLDTAKTAVLQRFIVEKAIHTMNLPRMSEKADALVSEALSRDLALAVELLDVAAFDALLKDFFSWLQKMQGIDGQYIYDAWQKLIELFHAACVHHGWPLERGFIELGERRFNRCSTLNQVIEMANTFLTAKIRDWDAQRKQSSTKPIRLGKQYINENYWMPVTLEELGDRVGLNPAYFSTLFKKETGKTFKEYLAETRVEEAKRLLRETDMNVADLAGEVGYSDTKYFTKLFKKLTGLTPVEYKRLYH